MVLSYKLVDPSLFGTRGQFCMEDSFSVGVGVRGMGVGRGYGGSWGNEMVQMIM